LAIAAMAFSTLLYKYTLRAWFQEDDFAWLGLGLQVDSWRGFLYAMFAPMAQGTIRPLSERAFYMTFFSLFELNALPYRIMVYVTELADIALLTAVAYALTKSYAASFLAPVLWVANIALALPVTWTAAYNEILCSFFFLLSFLALVRYVETGNRRFNLLQWASYLLCFGVLEINVVYPLIAMLYVVLRAPRFLKQTSILLVPAALFVVVDAMVRAAPKGEVYRLHWDASIFGTLLTYWRRALGPSAAAEAFPRIHFYPVALTILISVGLLGFVVVRAARGDRLPVFFLGWFLLALAPFLPIRAHISDYYLTVPVIGLALLGAWGIALSLETGPHAIAHRGVAAVLLVAYLTCSIPATRKLSRDIWARSVPVKKLVLGIEADQRNQPDKTILLEGVDDMLFWNGVYDHPFRLIDLNSVYLTEDTARKLTPYPDLAKIADYTLPQSAAMAGLAAGRIVVYAVENGQVRNITGLYKAATLGSELPRRIDLAKPPMETLLGASWYAPEGDFRWMPKQATVRLGALESGSGELRIDAFCSPVQVQTKPLTVAVTVLDVRFAPVEIRDCAPPVKLRFPVRTQPGQKELQVTIEVDHTVRVGADQRDLGLAVRSIEIASQP
jgi:hypothetical protein